MYPRTKTEKSTELLIEKTSKLIFKRFFRELRSQQKDKEISNIPLLPHMYNTPTDTIPHQSSAFVTLSPANIMYMKVHPCCSTFSGF
jgi:hypothetical protein